VGAEADGGDDSRVSGEDEVSRGVGHEMAGMPVFERESVADGSGAAVVPDDDHGDHQHGRKRPAMLGDNDLRSDRLTDRATE